MIKITAQIDNELARLAGDQLPFATSLALNRTANDARDAVREDLPGKLDLKNKGITRLVRSRASTKIRLLAAIEGPGFLAKHETGATIRPTRTRLLASLAPGVSKRSLVRALDTGTSFTTDMGGGRAGIFQRKARGRIRLLAWLTPEQNYDDTLSMEGTVEDVVQRRFSQHFADALGQAMATRKKR